MRKKSRIIKSLSEILLWSIEYLIISAIFLGLGFYIGTTTDIKHAYEAHYVYTEECKDDNNMDKISLFMKWSDITDAEKMEAIQALVNAEAYDLGLYEKLNIEICDNMSDTKLGSYIDIDRSIKINKKYFDESDGCVVMDTVIHEAFHNFQCRMVDTLEEISEEERSLTIFNSAVRFSQEFSEYDDLKKDFDKYYDLNVERSAREWATKRVEMYSKKILDYMNSEER